MFAVIPSVVMKDPALSMSARMLYGIVTWKCNENAYCWATNRALGEVLGLSAKRISALISDLESHGHIETELIKDPDTGEVKGRYIYPVVKSGRCLETPPPKNGDTPIPKNGDTSPRNQGDPPPKNEEDIYEKHKEETKKESNPPKAPRGGRRGQAPKKEPDWKPERFARFWAYYPRGEAKQAAIRAWDKLQPSDELIDTMAQALKRQAASEGWRQGVGIPYAATWLNQQRWTDEPRRGGQAPGGHVVEEEGAYYL